MLRTTDRESRTVRPSRKQLLLIALFAVGAIAATVLLLSRRPVAVEVLEIKPQTVEQALAVVGRARPKDVVQVASPNPGQVIRLLHDDGDRVAAGAPLAVIRATVEQALTEADFARARAARAEAADARLRYDRTLTLMQKGFAAPAALDVARATLQAADANVAAAAAAARASSERTREFIIRAPMSGTVLLRPIDNGQVVTAGETLFELGSSAGSEIRADVDEAYADVLRPGLTARAALSGSATIFPALVTEVSPRIDSATGGRQVKLAPAAGQELSPGRSVDLTIVVRLRQDAIVLPRSAVMDATVAPKVYVVNSQGIVALRQVSVMRWPSANAIIERGLREGDRVVLDPATTRPGAHVRPVAPTPDG